MKRIVRNLLFLTSIILLFSCGESYRMVGESMVPTIKDGDFFSADLVAYEKQLPERWDIIIFNSPPMPEKDWVMRVVGLPGEEIDYDSLGLTANGKRLS